MDLPAGSTSCVDNKIIGQRIGGDKNFKYVWVGLGDLEDYVSGVGLELGRFFEHVKQGPRAIDSSIRLDSEFEGLKSDNLPAKGTRLCP
jgi:hypothetical protein